MTTVTEKPKGHHNFGRGATTVEKLLKSEPFQRGFNEVLSGLPYNHDAYERQYISDAYERGRQFAYVYKGPLLSTTPTTYHDHRNRPRQTMVSGYAASAFVEAMKNNWIR